MFEDKNVSELCHKKILMFIVGEASVARAAPALNYGQSRVPQRSTFNDLSDEKFLSEPLKIIIAFTIYCF